MRYRKVDSLSQRLELSRENIAITEHLTILTKVKYKIGTIQSMIVTALSNKHALAIRLHSSLLDSRLKNPLRIIILHQKRNR